MQQRTITGITTRQTQHGNVAPRRLSHPPKKGRKYCINGETRIKYYAYAFSVSGAHKLNKTQCWVGPQSLSGCCESFPWHPDFSRCGAWLGPPSPATPTFVVSSIKKQRQPAKTKGDGQTNALIFLYRWIMVQERSVTSPSILASKVDSSIKSYKLYGKNRKLISTNLI